MRFNLIMVLPNANLKFNLIISSVCIFISCSKQAFQNPCDYSSSFFLNSLLLKYAINDTSQHCGVNFLVSLHDFSPTSGYFGTKVKINGNGFSNILSNNTVKFNGRTAILTEVNSSSLTALAPSLGASGPISISIANITVNSVNSFLFNGFLFLQALNLTGNVSSLAGSPGTSGYIDGAGSNARFLAPRDITTDGQNLFVTDSGNNVVRKIIIVTGEVSTVAGISTAGSTDGIGTSARFSVPRGITTDGTNLYVTDSANHTIRKIVIATGEVTTIAGLAGVSGSSDGTGSSARFNGPVGVASDGTNLYITEFSNHTIRKIVISTGVVSSYAGLALTSGNTNGNVTSARFFNPIGITTDGLSLYIGDSSNHAVRKIDLASSEVSTIAGSGTSGSNDGIGNSATFNNPNGVSTDGTFIYVADRANHTIRKIAIATSEVTTIAGMAGVAGSAEGNGLNAKFNFPSGLTQNGTELFITDFQNQTIRKIQ